MKKNMKVLALCLALLLLTALAFACAPSTPPQTGGETSPGGTNATTPQPEGSGKVAELYIYNSKGENATQFEAMCKAYTQETGVPVKAFSIGSGQDHMETLRAEMGTSNPPAIFSIQGLKELQEWQEGGFVVDLASAADANFKALHDSVAPGLRLTTDGTNSFGIPYNVEGYGYIVDKQMVSDLAGADKADALIEDLKKCSYDEWEKFVLALDALIKSGTKGSVTLAGNTYDLAKTGLAEKLTGVFAVMGSQRWTYGDHFVNVALNAAFPNPAAAFDADAAKIDSLTNIFKAYAKALDFKTSHMADIKRGPEFVQESNTGYDQTVARFADSKAVFLKQGNWAFGNIKDANAEMADRLDFIPVKMPITQGDIQTPDLTVEKFNASIPVFVPNYYAINAKVSPEVQKEAMNFLVWLNTSETGKKFITEDFAFIPYNADPAQVKLNNSLGNAILRYIAAGNTLAAPYHGAPASWSGDVLGKYLLENYMNKAEWQGEASYEDIAKYAIAQWKDLK